MRALETNASPEYAFKVPVNNHSSKQAHKSLQTCACVESNGVLSLYNPSCMQITAQSMSTLCMFRIIHTSNLIIRFHCYIWYTHSMSMHWKCRRPKLKIQASFIYTHSNFHTSAKLDIHVNICHLRQVESAKVLHNSEGTGHAIGRLGSIWFCLIPGAPNSLSWTVTCWFLI